MDHELKQRLIGAVVVTALAAIFVPMLFDDPVENSAQLVTEQSIPVAPNTLSTMTEKLPTNAEQVLSTPEQQSSSESAANGAEESAVLSDEIDDSQVKPANAEDALYAETPGYAEEGAEPLVDEPLVDVAKPVITSKPVAKDQDVKKVSKPKVSPSAPEQELLKKVQAAKLQEDAAAKKAIQAKKLESLSLAKEVPKQVNPAVKAPVVAAKKANVASKPSTPSRWYIQVGSFSKKENALSLWEGLRGQGLPASLDTVQTDKGTTYRLRVGPELDGKKAAAMKAKLDKQNIKSILIAE